jgi:uncharacterized protein YegP (UPF0339 family)/outer membrane protein OmpA-like peptidoglycan-associated protein
MRQDGSDNRFRFTLLNSNENVLLNSIAFESRELCVAAIREAIQQLPVASAYQIDNAQGSYSVKLRTLSGGFTGSSPALDTEVAAQALLDSMLNDASDETEYQVSFSSSSGTSSSEAIELPSLTNIDFASFYDFTYEEALGKEHGIVPFYREDKKEYYFHIHDASAGALLYSRGFDSAGRRDKRARQVIDAGAKATRYEIKEEGGSFFFILKERNGLEIARSRRFGSAAQANSAITYIQNILPSFEEAYPKVEKTKRKSSANQYDWSLSGTGESGFETMRGADKGYYFIFNCGGVPILYSQSYSSGAGRDNGVRAVIRSAGEIARYERKEEAGKHYFILRSVNRQEIAHSAYFDSAEALENAIECSLKSIRYAEQWGVVFNTANQLTTTTETFTLDVEKPILLTMDNNQINNETNRFEDDYLPCSSYAGHEATEQEGFTKFQNTDNGKYYFTWLDAHGDVLFRSEGYPATAARDNGLDSVLRNRDNADRYKTWQMPNGKWVVSLRAGNHQEIARTCPFDSEDEANGWRTRLAAPAVMAAESTEIHVEASIPEVAPIAAVVASASMVAEEAPSIEVAVPAEKEDDYLACKEYLGYDINDKQNNVALFKHENGQFYFVIYKEDGSVRLRSEGFTHARDRDVELSGVLRNLNNPEMYTTVERAGHVLHILKDKTGREVGRSCLEKIAVAAPVVEVEAPKVEVAPLAAVAAAAIVIEAPSVEVAAPVVEVAAAVEAPVVEVAAPVVEAPVVAAKKEKEDDYLACKEYEGRTINDKQNKVALFKHENGQYYFVLYKEDGSVRLRSEGFAHARDRDSELSGVLRNLNNPDMYTTVERAGHILHILKDKTGREVGRSCLEKIAVAAPAPVVEVEAPKVEVAPLAAVAAAAAVVANIPSPEAPKVEVAAPVVEPPVVAAKVEKEDDYLVCSQYEGRTINDKQNNVAMFKHENGQYYFVIYKADGSVRLRSEGFGSARDRDSELSGALKNLNNPEMYSTIERAGHVLHILKDKTGREVGRSCFEKEGSSPVVPLAAVGAATLAAATAHVELPKVEVPAPVVATPEVEAPVVAAATAAAAALAAKIASTEKVELPKFEPTIPPPIIDKTVAAAATETAASGGIGKWWPLLLLALPLLWFLWKGCGKEEVKAVVPTPTPKVETTTVTPTPTPAPAPTTKLGVKQFLPVVLYFDNDQPDANTVATKTQKTYGGAFDAYYGMRDAFAAKGDGKATASFFEGDVKKGMTDLEKLASALVEITKGGEKVKLSVHGFASPLAKNDYNQALTGRRVSSIENYLKTYKGGVLAKYISDGSIKLALTTSGEEKAKTGISDDAKNKKNSIYSVDASKERRVEITGIE